MGSYSITCGTCQARLTVRKPEAAGQIHTCPRCGGMVLIQPPEASDPGQPPPRTNSPGRSRWRDTPSSSDSFTMLAASGPGETGPAAAAGNGTNDAEVLSRPFEYIDRLLEQPRSFEIKSEDASTEAGTASPDAEDSASASTRQRSRRVIWMGSAVAVAGVLLATWFLSWRRASPEPVSVRKPIVAKPAVEDTPQDASTVAQAPEISPAVSSVAAAEGLPPAPAPERPPAPAQKPPSPDVLPADQPPAIASRKPVVAFTVDPHHFAAESAPLQFQVTLRRVGQPPVARSSLSRTVDQLELPDTTLSAFCHLMEQMSGLPVTIRGDCLVMARVGPLDAMAIAVKKSSLGAAFASGLRPLHLGYRQEGPHVIIDHLAVLRGRPARLRLPVADLTSKGWTDQELERTVRNAVSPSRWRATEGPRATLHVAGGVLETHVEPAIQFQVLEFVERLRLAHGIPTRTAYGAHLESMPRRDLLAQANLSRLMVSRTGHGVPMAEWLADLEEQANMALLVDWQALASQEISRQSTLRFNQGPLPLGQLLPAVLDPLGLAYEVLADDFLRITTKQQQDQTYHVGIYPLRSLLARTAAEPEQVAATLQAAFVSQLRQEGTELPSDESCFLIDPTRTLLIVRLPVQQQLRFCQGFHRLPGSDNSLAQYVN